MGDDFVLVIDLEATCADDGSIIEESMETIEIGACFSDLEGNIGARFQSFVRPIHNPLLTDFCKKLIGVRQEDVDFAPLFPAAADLLREFVEQHRAIETVWVSWGAYDQKQIMKDSLRHSIANPLQIKHQNAKRLFAKTQRIGKEVGMTKALQLAGLSFEGTHHRALDDALNIARLLPWIFKSKSITNTR